MSGYGERFSTVDRFVRKTGETMKKLKIQQIRSSIGRNEKQRKTLRALGITRMGQTVEHEATPQIEGMIAHISHLLSVEEI